MATSKRIDFSDSVKKELFAWSNGYCMICGKAAAMKKQGEAAHIIPASENGPRSEYRKDRSEEFITSSLNGLWLCPNCHAEIDSGNSKYSCDDLFKINERFRYRYEIQGSFYEDLHIKVGTLENLADKLKEKEDLNMKNETYQDDMKRLCLDDKNKINELSGKQKRYISSSFSNEFIHIYRDIIDEELSVEASYLSSALKALYKKISGNVASQEKIFEEMLVIMKKTMSEYNLNEIGILSYYYAVCEIFKKE